MIEIEPYKVLPPDLWGEHEDMKKKGKMRESAWYVKLMEDVAIAAWILRHNPTQEALDNLDRKLKKWDKKLGWGGKLQWKCPNCACPNDGSAESCCECNWSEEIDKKERKKVTRD